jgi:hypothetical protein
MVLYLLSESLLIICVHRFYCSDDQIKAHEIVRACSTKGSHEETLLHFNQKI